MSDVNLGTATGRLTLETSGFGQSIGRAQGYLLSLEPIVARQWWGLQNLGRAFGAMGGMVAAGLGLAVREAVAWETAMVGVGRTTYDSAKSADQNAEALKVLEGELRQVANTTPIAAHELAGLAEAAGALGVEDVAKFTETMGTLIATTDLTDASAEDLGRTLNVLGVPEESFERFASTLIDVGRNTAATETEILNMARRLAPMARMAGMTAYEVLGLGAAVISLGPRAEAGSSAITRMIGDISASIAEGGEASENWAQVAGIPGDKFEESWRTDASATIEKIIVGLGKFEGNVVGLSSVLDHLDQSNVRNVITLGALASGINDVDNQQTSLIAINKAAEESWRENVAMAQVAKARYGTAAAQIQILRNRVAEAANTVGKVLLPAIRFAVSLITDLTVGFQNLPGVLQWFFAGLILVAGGISLLAGAALALIGPLVLMLHTWRSLRTHMEGTAGSTGTAKAAMDILTGSVNANTAATTRNIAAQTGLRNAQGQLTASSLTSMGRNQAGQLVAQTAATEGAAVATSRLWTNMSRLGRVGIVVTGVIAAATIAMAIFGRQQKKNNEDTEQGVEANVALTDAINDQARGLSNAADEWILQEAVMSGMINTAETLGVAMSDLVAIVNGSASADFARPIIDSLNEQAEAGDEGARELLEWLGTTHRVYRESASAAGVLTSAREALAAQNGETVDSEAGLDASIDTAAEKAEHAAQATFDLVDAMIANRVAALDLKDAQADYAKALAEAANPADRLAEAEITLYKARSGALKAERDLAEAEEDLLTARQRQRDDLADAEDSLADARDSYLDSLEAITKAEEELDKLRKGPTLEDMLEATNKLANAQLKLRDAHQAVEDAEWQLAYLRGEGASDRAIQDAEFALEDARQDVANATETVGEAESELNDLRTATPDEIAAAERDLASARRDSQEALRSIAEKEAEVRDLRQDVAADTAYKDAQADVYDAQLNVRDALREVIAAQMELNRLRAGGIQDDVARAQLDLENALIGSAKAATEVQKQQAAMRGEFWDTGKEAHVLADNIAMMAANAPDAATRKRLLDYVAILRGAKSGGGGAAGAGATKGKPASGNDLTGMLPKGEDVAKETDNGIRGALESILSMIAGRFVAGLLATILGLFGIALGGWAILIISLIAGFLIDKFLKSEIGKKMVDGLIHGLTVAADAIGRFLHSLWFDYIWGPIKRLFGISSPSTEFAKIGKWLIEGLVNGAVAAFTAVTNFFGGIGRKIINLFIGAGSWLLDKGMGILIGLKNGVINGWNSTIEFLGSIPGKIGGFFKGAATWLVSTGQNIVVGLANGIASLLRHIPFIGGNLADTLINAVNKTLGVHSPSKVFETIGQQVVRGFTDGIEGSLSTVDRAMLKFAQAAVLPDAIFFDDVMQQFNDATSAAVAEQQAEFGGYAGSNIPTSNGDTTNEGDVIQITGADERDALDIAEEVMFRKMVRTN